MARGSQVSNHLRQKLRADTLSFKLWQHRQHNYFSTGSISETVPNQLAARRANVARTLSGADVTSP